MIPGVSATLPPDVASEIFRHMHAMQIQQCFRKFSFRHTTMNRWNILLKLLAQSIPNHFIDILFQNEMVRREWRMEMDSWIHGFKKEKIHIIIQEVQDGLWIIPREKHAHDSSSTLGASTKQMYDFSAPSG